MFVDNMNRRDTGWAVGSCVSGDEVCISYSHAFCYEALEQMASTLNTEFEFNGKTVSLRKVEYNTTLYAHTDVATASSRMWGVLTMGKRRRLKFSTFRAVQTI